ncbi:hypothetical protein GOP47_0010906 [Adiantum capillus-veneris]|uniref:Uncharacterized protein n=1 Tax=Adiantum capillus-veneris TaxID=13818 RepID=A0A9D4UW70_ADICA|nr:hypothetical protein GOP47_0010906 [Adiantum capillus-veneris]
MTSCNLKTSAQQAYRIAIGESNLGPHHCSPHAHICSNIWSTGEPSRGRLPPMDLVDSCAASLSGLNGPRGRWPIDKGGHRYGSLGCPCLPCGSSSSSLFGLIFALVGWWHPRSVQQECKCSRGTLLELLLGGGGFELWLL